MNGSRLDGEKRKMVEEVLLRCREVFSKDDSDIGDIKNFKMPIHLVVEQFQVGQIVQHLNHSII